MERDEVQKTLDKFIERVVNQSKRSLTLQSKNKTRKLHKSISGDAKVNPNSFELSFSMEDYGKFQDRGVKGVGGRKADGSTWRRHRVTRNGFDLNRPYSFKSLRPPASAFRTDKINRPVSLGRSFATAETVYRQGIRTSEFFTKPFESAFRDLPDELVEAYGLDIEDFLDFALNTE